MEKTSDIYAYLVGRSRLECIKDGFESIPAGASLPLQVTEEKWTAVGRRIAADGTERTWTRTHREYIIQLTGPDGTRHRFLTDPAEASKAPPLRLCPAGINAPIKHHSIATFVEFFHVPVPSGLENTAPPNHALLDLLEAITEAASANIERPMNTKTTA